MVPASPVLRRVCSIATCAFLLAGSFVAVPAGAEGVGCAAGSCDEGGINTGCCCCAGSGDALAAPCGECSQCKGGCGGPLCSRTQLTGDWFGVREHFADHGITLDADATMFYMGVADGGLDREFRFGGHNDYVWNADLDKLAGHQGLFLKVRAEHRYGESLRGATGALLPSNVVADLPVPESEEIYLSNVLFTQMFSERFGVFFGKLDTFDGDPNAFAGGRGKTQFSHTAFVINPVTLRTVPYSTLGLGFVILGDGAEPLFNFSILNPTDTVKTSGFDELFAEGVLISAELRLPTNYFSRPGHQLLGGTWNSRDVASLQQDPRIILPNVPIARQSGSWSLYWNFDQYLQVDRCDPTRGWGVFGRAGIGDDETNPLASFLSFGVGGHSGRAGDTFGAGWYYSRTSDEVAPFLTTALGGIGNGQGVELYYNIELTPWCQITPDLQFVQSARESVETATVAGLRARLIF